MQGINYFPKKEKERNFLDKVMGCDKVDPQGAMLTMC